MVAIVLHQNLLNYSALLFSEVPLYIPFLFPHTYQDMGVTEGTIKIHLSLIFQKTPVSDRLELALLMKGELPERIRINLQ